MDPKAMEGTIYILDKFLFAFISGLVRPILSPRGSTPWWYIRDQSTLKRSKMKTAVLIACMLTIIHADKILTGKKFAEKIMECKKENMKIPGLKVDHNIMAIYCATKRIGAIDDEDVPLKDKILKNCEILTSDSVKAQQCKDICTTCIDEAFKNPGSNFIRTIKGVQCVVSQDLMSIINLE